MWLLFAKSFCNAKGQDDYDGDDHSNAGHVYVTVVGHGQLYQSTFNVNTLPLTKLNLFYALLYLLQVSQMSDDGFGGGGGDDYDYESGPGCVKKKINNSFVY
jgi:hypothetical protein